MTDWTQAENIEKLHSIFMPYAFARMKDAKDRNVRFCHYTSADAALKIIRGKEVWLRNSVLMNDFSEVQYGLNCLQQCWVDEELGGKLKKLLGKWGEGIDAEIEQSYNQRHFERRHESYILSISEHGDPDFVRDSSGVDEDRVGRLSMWRAYGGDTNVAFVFNNGPFFTPSDALKAYTSPVLYADMDGYKREFARFLDGFEKNIDFLETLSRDFVRDQIINAFHFATLSTKHPGFKEEREWRVIYSPTVERSDKIIPEVVSLGGVPQRIYKLPLENYPVEGYFGATIPELLNRLIIGPTQFPWPMYDAFVEELGKQRVHEPSTKVFVSDIPLRR